MMHGPINVKFTITFGILLLFMLVTSQSLLCGSQTIDHVAACLTIWDRPDLDEDFMREHGAVCRCVGRCACERFGSP